MTSKHRRLLTVLLLLVGFLGAVAFAQTTTPDVIVQGKCVKEASIIAPSTDWVNINLQSFIPNASCWMNDTFYTVARFKLFDIMARFGQIVLMIFFLKSVLDGWTSRNFAMVIRVALLSIVASALLNDSIKDHSISNKLYSTPINLWRSIYKTSSGMVQDQLKTDVVDNTKDLAKTVGDFVLNAMLATNSMTSFEGDSANLWDEIQTKPDQKTQITVNAANSALHTIDQTNKDITSNIKNMGLVFQIGYLLMLGFFMAFAGVIYFSGLTIIICMFAFPLAVAFWASGNSRPVQTIFMTILVSLGTVAIVPVIMSVAANLAIKQPTATLKAQMDPANNDAKVAVAAYASKSIGCAQKVSEASKIKVIGPQAAALANMQCQATSTIPFALKSFGSALMRIVIGMMVMVMTMVMCIGIGVAMLRHVPSLLGQLFSAAGLGGDHNNVGGIAMAGVAGAAAISGGVASGAGRAISGAGRALNKGAGSLMGGGDDENPKKGGGGAGLVFGSPSPAPVPPMPAASSAPTAIITTSGRNTPPASVVSPGPAQTAGPTTVTPPAPQMAGLAGSAATGRAAPVTTAGPIPVSTPASLSGAGAGAAALGAGVITLSAAGTQGGLAAAAVSATATTAATAAAAAVTSTSSMSSAAPIPPKPSNIASATATTTEATSVTSSSAQSSINLPGPGGVISAAANQPSAGFGATRTTATGAVSDITSGTSPSQVNIGGTTAASASGRGEAGQATQASTAQASSNPTSSEQAQTKQAQTEQASTEQAQTEQASTEQAQTEQTSSKQAGLEQVAVTDEAGSAAQATNGEQASEPASTAASGQTATTEPATEQVAAPEKPEEIVTQSDEANAGEVALAAALQAANDAEKASQPGSEEPSSAETSSAQSDTGSGETANAAAEENVPSQLSGASDREQEADSEENAAAQSESAASSEKEGAAAPETTASEPAATNPDTTEAPSAEARRQQAVLNLAREIDAEAQSTAAAAASRADTSVDPTLAPAQLNKAGQQGAANPASVAGGALGQTRKNMQARADKAALAEAQKTMTGKMSQNLRAHLGLRPSQNVASGMIGKTASGLSNAIRNQAAVQTRTADHNRQELKRQERDPDYVPNLKTTAQMHAQMKEAGELPSQVRADAQAVRAATIAHNRADRAEARSNPDHVAQQLTSAQVQDALASSGQLPSQISADQARIDRAMSEHKTRQASVDPAMRVQLSRDDARAVLTSQNQLSAQQYRAERTNILSGQTPEAERIGGVTDAAVQAAEDRIRRDPELIEQYAAQAEANSEAASITPNQEAVSNQGTENAQGEENTQAQSGAQDATDASSSQVAASPQDSENPQVQSGAQDATDASSSQAAASPQGEENTQGQSSAQDATDTSNQTAVSSQASENTQTQSGAHQEPSGRNAQTAPSSATTAAQGTPPTTSGAVPVAQTAETGPVLMPQLTDQRMPVVTTANRNTAKTAATLGAPAAAFNTASATPDNVTPTRSSAVGTGSGRAENLIAAVETVQSRTQRSEKEQEQSGSGLNAGTVTPFNGSGTLNRDAVNAATALTQGGGVSTVPGAALNKQAIRAEQQAEKEREKAIAGGAIGIIAYNLKHARAGAGTSTQQTAPAPSERQVAAVRRQDMNAARQEAQADYERKDRASEHGPAAVRVTAEEMYDRMSVQRRLPSQVQEDRAAAQKAENKTAGTQAYVRDMLAAARSPSIPGEATTTSEKYQALKREGRLPSQKQADNEAVRIVTAAHNAGENRRTASAPNHIPQHLNAQQVRHTMASNGMLPSQHSANVARADQEIASREASYQERLKTDANTPVPNTDYPTVLKDLGEQGQLAQQDYRRGVETSVAQLKAETQVEWSRLNNQAGGAPSTQAASAAETSTQNATTQNASPSEASTRNTSTAATTSTAPTPTQTTSTATISTQTTAGTASNATAASAPTTRATPTAGAAAPVAPSAVPMPDLSAHGAQSVTVPRSASTTRLGAPASDVVPNEPVRASRNRQDTEQPSTSSGPVDQQTERIYEMQAQEDQRKASELRRARQETLSGAEGDAVPDLSAAAQQAAAEEQWRRQQEDQMIDQDPSSVPDDWEDSGNWEDRE